MNRTIGIDLGTSNSAGVVLKDGKMRIVPSDEGPIPHGKMHPSVVAFKPNGETLVGKEAKEYAYYHPERVVRWIKRRMGTDYTFNIDGATFTPQEISAMILRKIKVDAERFIGERIDQAVITAPAYFNNNQRNATKEAGELAGFEVLRILSEPTAAALAYGLNFGDAGLKVAVLDLGAGTFDVTFLEMSRGVFNVLSTCGDTSLGGKDMDDAILDYLVAEVERKDSIDLSCEPLAMNILRDGAEEAKIKLSRSSRVSIDLMLPVESQNVRLRLVLTRSKLERLLSNLVDRLDEPIMRALDDSGLAENDIDRLVLVGGPTAMPVVRKSVQEIFGVKPEEGIDPMGVVATGAFVQASVLKGEISNMLLLDVIPLSLGIETTGGIFTRLINRNTTIPVEVARVFATEEDNQTSMMIHVLQGERETARGNTSLGLFKIEGIPGAPRFEQEVEVTFHVDANGVLRVLAKVLETGETVSVSIRSAKELSESDIVKMIIDATQFDAQDTMCGEAARIRQNAEAVLYGARNSVERFKDTLTEDERHRFIEASDRLELSMLTRETFRIEKCAAELAKLVEDFTLKARRLKRAKLLLSSVASRKVPEELSRIKDSMEDDACIAQNQMDDKMRRLTEVLTLLEVDRRDS